MSATLTWASSGLVTKTGTTVAALIADIVSLVNSKSGDSSFYWQVASSSTASSPNYVVLKRKDGSAGRILLVVWTSAPAGNNAAILDGAPTTNSLYGAWFPSGNVDTPSNLTASSGTILGDDTNCVKVWAAMAAATIYAASIQSFYFDSAEAMYFGFQNPANTTAYFAGAGSILVDGSDNAYDGVIGTGTGGSQLGASPGSTLAYSATAVLANSTTACVRTNYGSSNRTYFLAWYPSSAWANVAVSSTDILTATASNLAYFVPLQLLGQTKGEGFILKLRQVALGPGTVGPLTAYNTTGPVVAARQFNAATSGANGMVWMTNFKL